MNRKQISDKLYRLCTRSAVFIFTLVSVYMFFLSLFSTAYISSKKNQFHEYTYFVKDNPFLQFALVIGACLLLALASRWRAKKEFGRLAAKKRLLVVPFFFWLVLVVWIFSSQIKPGSDQYYIFDCAARIAEKDYSVFAPGGYLERYPFQTFFVMIVYCFQFVFGKYHFLAFQCMNALFLSGAYLVFRKISKEIFQEESVSNVTYLLSAFFFPLSFYVGFCYGSVPGLFFALLGTLYGIRYLNNLDNKNAILSALILAVCPHIKNSCLIFLIAYSIILFVAFIRNHQWKNFFVIVGMVGTYFLINTIVKAIVLIGTGYTLSKGYPLIGQIAMGLQKNEMLANGWFNSFTVAVYEQAGYDYDMAHTIYLQELKYRIVDLWTNKGTALRFFAEKIASQWNNPTFQSLWYYNARDSLIQRGSLVESLICGTGARILCSLANWMQSFFLFGNLAYLYYRRKKIKLGEVFLQVCFLGGFFLHMLVEAKSQYVLMFYFMLTPLVAKGLAELVTDMKQTVINRKISPKLSILLISIFVFILIIQFVPGEFFDVLFKMEKDAYLLQTDQWM